MHGSLVVIAVLRAHRERAGGDVTPTEAVLVERELVEEPAALTRDRLVVRDEPVRAIERRRGFFTLPVLQEAVRFDERAFAFVARVQRTTGSERTVVASGRCVRDTSQGSGASMSP